MRILFLAPQPFFAERGTPIRSSNVLKAHAEAGHQVDVLCYPFGRPFELPGLRIIRVARVPGISEVKVGPSYAKLPLDFLMMIQAFGLCLLRHYDVIEAVEESAFFALFLKGLFGSRLVYHMDSYISDHVEYSGFLQSGRLLDGVRVVERAAMRAADVVVTVNATLSDEVRSIAPKTRVLQLEDAPREDRFREDADGARRLRAEFGLGDHPVALYTGNFGPYQGLDILARASGLVARKRPDVRILFVGGEPHEVEAVREIARREGSADLCVFAGRRPTAEMTAFVSAAQVLVSPRSHGTNTPLKIYEYMQSGRPIVATHLHTHTQVLDDTCAFLAAPEPEAFARGILDAFEEADKARRLAGAAAARLEERYSLRIFRKKVQDTFADLASDGQRISFSSRS